MIDVVEKIVQREKLFCGDGDIRIEPLAGGLVNHAYKISTDSAEYFLRISSAQYKHLNLDLAQEFQALSLASAQRIAPKALSYDEGIGYLVLEYLPSEKVNIQEFRNPENLARLFEKLQRVHQFKTVDRRCNAYYLIERYIAGARQAGVSVAAEFDGFLKRMREIEQSRAENVEETHCFCHNDLYTINVLKSGQEYYLIDWELCGVGDIYFDLAIFPSIYRYTQDQEVQLLEAYFGKGKVGEEHLVALQDLKYVNVVREAAWAYFYSGLGIQFETHAFDYAGHAARTVEKLIAGENSLGI
jgi:thiamine kinase-like enzyme